MPKVIDVPAGIWTLMVDASEKKKAVHALRLDRAKKIAKSKKSDENQEMFKDPLQEFYQGFIKKGEL